MFPSYVFYLLALTSFMSLQCMPDASKPAPKPSARPTGTPESANPNNQPENPNGQPPGGTTDPNAVGDPNATSNAECVKKGITLKPGVDVCVHPLTQELVTACIALTKSSTKKDGDFACTTNRWIKSVYDSTLKKLGGDPGKTIISNPPMPNPK
jgi:hypothetical protein